MKQLSVVADYGDLCGEAPMWDGEAGYLYWTDNIGLKFYRFQPATGIHELIKEGVEIFGIALHEKGGFMISNLSGIWVWDVDDQFSLITDEVEGSKCHMNDCIADVNGRLFAGSFFYHPSKEYELGKLIRVDVDGSGSIVDEGFHISNGLGFSPDNTILYFTDSGARVIYAYDYDPRSGDIKNRRVAIKIPDDEGIPDGLTIDADGYIWSAQWYGSSVLRYDPDGKLERRLDTPAKQTSSIIFGGEDLTDIFITSAAMSEPMPLMPRGYDPDSGYFGGQLYHVNLGIKGKPEHRAKINK